MSKDKIDDIILKPAHWQEDDYKKARQQLYELISGEVIGEDEGARNCPCAHEHRNQLRQEQRTKLKHLFNIGEE